MPEDLIKDLKDLLAHAHGPLNFETPFTFTWDVGTDALLIFSGERVAAKIIRDSCIIKMKDDVDIVCRALTGRNGRDNFIKALQLMAAFKLHGVSFNRAYSRATPPVRHTPTTAFHATSVDTSQV